MMSKTEYPPGWDEQRVRAVIDHDERQSEDEAVAEYLSALEKDAGVVERYGKWELGEQLASEVAEASPEYDAGDPPHRDNDS